LFFTKNLQKTTFLDQALKYTALNYPG